MHEQFRKQKSCDFRAYRKHNTRLFVLYNYWAWYIRYIYYCHPHTISGVQPIFEIFSVFLWILSPTVAGLYFFKGYRAGLKEFIYSTLAVSFVYTVISLDPAPILSSIGSFSGLFPYSSINLLPAIPSAFLLFGYIKEKKSIEKAYYYTSISAALILTILYLLPLITSIGKITDILIVTHTLGFLLIMVSIALIGAIGGKGRFGVAKRGYIYLAVTVVVSSISSYLLMSSIPENGGDMLVGLVFLSRTLILTGIASLLFLWSAYNYWKA